MIRRTGQPPVFSIQYLRRKATANSGLTYTPQFSSALDGSGDWSTATGTETVQSIDSEWERVTVEENASGKEKRFGRVKVMSGELVFTRAQSLRTALKLLGREKCPSFAHQKK